MYNLSGLRLIPQGISRCPLIYILFDGGQSAKSHHKTGLMVLLQPMVLGISETCATSSRKLPNCSSKLEILAWHWPVQMSKGHGPSLDKTTEHATKFPTISKALVNIQHIQNNTEHCRTGFGIRPRSWSSEHKALHNLHWFGTISWLPLLGQNAAYSKWTVLRLRVAWHKNP